MIQLESIEHDYIRSLKSQSCKQMSTWSRKDSVEEVLSGLGALPTGDNIFHWICFSRSKVSAANIGIIAILVHLKKL